MFGDYKCEAHEVVAESFLVYAKILLKYDIQMPSVRNITQSRGTTSMQTESINYTPTRVLLQKQSTQSSNNMDKNASTRKLLQFDVRVG